MSEAFLRAFHAAHAGAMSRAFERGGSYERLAALVPPGARVLDLACGDGALLRWLGDRAIGIDVSHHELELAQGRVAQARAQALPIAANAIDVCTCHLAFMLFDEPERVVAELARVIAPGGAFLAVLGGGPTAEGPRDAFHEFLAILDEERRIPALGDPRTRRETGWRELFAGWNVAPFERWEIDLGGTFDEIWQFASTSYELSGANVNAIRDELHARVGDRGACRAAMFLARAERVG
ncbi:MAG TPA: class I SAM-dependent methyltransferase [Kofleriaceae bacterium]|jgi:SAM-dependent methyltransferase